jgi:cell division protein FtsB
MSRRPTSPAARAGSPAGTGPTRGPRTRVRAAEPRPVRLARVLSVRAIVFGVVVLLGFTVLFPTVRAYLGQRAELQALEAQVAQAEEDERALQRELDRWQDPAYVVAQARERLSYVMPGETAYRVIDPEVVVEPEAEPGDPTPETGAALPPGGALAPWYATVWQSLEVAGNAQVAGAEVAGDGQQDGDEQTDEAGEDQQ